MRMVPPALVTSLGYILQKRLREEAGLKLRPQKAHQLALDILFVAHGVR